MNIPLTKEQQIHQRYIFLREAEYPNREIHNYLQFLFNGKLHEMNAEEKEAFEHTRNNLTKRNENGIFSDCSSKNRSF